MDLGCSCRLIAEAPCPPMALCGVPPSGDMEDDFDSSDGPFEPCPAPDPVEVPLVEPTTAEGLIEVNADSL